MQSLPLNLHRSMNMTTREVVSMCLCSERCSGTGLCVVLHSITLGISCASTEPSNQESAPCQAEALKGAIFCWRFVQPSHSSGWDHSSKKPLCKVPQNAWSLGWSTTSASPQRAASFSRPSNTLAKSD